MPRTMSSDEYLELGRGHFKARQYNEAVQAFTKGIGATTNPSVKLLDARAASYEKLGEPDAALKDGRDMIRRDKKDVKGYMRTASILEKTKRAEKAIEIYKYGMKNITSADPNFKILQQLHDRLTRKLAPASAIDPLTILPVELVEMVMSYLEFYEMVICLRVSKGWKTYLTKCPNLWLDLDLSAAIKKDTSRVFIRNAVKYSNYNVHRVVLNKFRHLDVLRNLASACKNLTHLEFVSGLLMSDTIVETVKCAQNLKTIIMHNEVSLDTVSQIFRFRPTLECAKFTKIAGAFAADWRGPFPSLKTLVLNQFLAMNRRMESYRVLHLPLLFELASRLKSLTLSHWKSDQSIPEFIPLELTELRLMHIGLLGLPQLPSSLERLSVLSELQTHLPAASDYLTMPGTIHGETWINAERSYVPNLVSLQLCSCQNMNSSFLHVLLDLHSDQAGKLVDHSSDESKPSPLRDIYFSHCLLAEEGAPSGRLARILAASPRLLNRDLQTLTLASITLDDDDIDLILQQNLPHLTSIDFSRTKITGAGVKQLVDKLPALRSLKLDDCERISSRDIVRYAEKKGITVSMKMAQLTSGKKIRFG